METSPPLFADTHPRVIRYLLRSSSLPSRLQPALDLLPPTSQAAVARFHFPADRKLALGSQLLQRLIILRSGLQNNVSIDSVILWKEPETGRPGVLPSASPSSTSPEGYCNNVVLVDYNVSHHSGLVVLAALFLSPPEARKVDGPHIPGTRRIGVDVVPTIIPRRRGATSSPAEFLDSFISPNAGIFTAHEISTILSCTTWPLKIRMFYIHWALKEAYVKATGTGLVTDLTRIEFRGVRVFDVDGDTAVKRFMDARLWVDGVERKEWYLEVEAYAFGDGICGMVDDDEGGDEVGAYYIALALQRVSELQPDGDYFERLEGDWEEVDFERDILPWKRNSIAI